MPRNLTPAEEAAYHNYVHTPTEANTAFVQLGKMISGTTGISSGSRVLDSFIIPTRPGWIRYWLARPGEGKSTMLRIIALTEAKRLIKEKLTDKYYVAFITWEEAIDSQEIYFQTNRNYKNEDFWRGTVKEPAIIAGGIDRPNLPIYMFGESFMKSNIDSKPMTIGRAIDGLRSVFLIEGKLPSLLLLDYIQEVEVDLPDGTKTTQKVVQAVRDTVMMGIRLMSPIEIGVQANQISLDVSPPIPGQRHMEYSFKTHQKATNGVSLWRPWITEKDKPKMQVANPVIKVGGQEYPFNPNLMVATPLKHRPGLLKMSIPFYLHPDTLIIKDVPGVLGP